VIKWFLKVNLKVSKQIIFFSGLRILHTYEATTALQWTMTYKTPGTNTNTTRKKCSNKIPTFYCCQTNIEPFVYHQVACTVYSYTMCITYIIYNVHDYRITYYSLYQYHSEHSNPLKPFSSFHAIGTHFLIGLGSRARARVRTFMYDVPTRIIIEEFPLVVLILYSSKVATHNIMLFARGRLYFDDCRSPWVPKKRKKK